MGRHKAQMRGECTETHRCSTCTMRGANDRTGAVGSERDDSMPPVRSSRRRLVRDAGAGGPGHNRRCETLGA
eukprot:7023128-Prymnesium_polylepis.1